MSIPYCVNCRSERLPDEKPPGPILRVSPEASVAVVVLLPLQKYIPVEVPVLLTRILPLNWLPTEFQAGSDIAGADAVENNGGIPGIRITIPEIQVAGTGRREVSAVGKRVAARAIVGVRSLLVSRYGSIECTAVEIQIRSE